MTHIPYAGNAPAINALLGDHVTAVFANFSEVVEQVGSGMLRALAVTTSRRLEPLPDVPTVAESGYKGYDVEVWFGLLAPAKTPKEQVAQLADWFTAAMQAPEVKPKLIGLGLYPVGTCGADYAAYIRSQYDDYRDVIKAANIKTE